MSQHCTTSRVGHTSCSADRTSISARMASPTFRSKAAVTFDLPETMANILAFVPTKDIMQAALINPTAHALVSATKDDSLKWKTFTCAANNPKEAWLITKPTPESPLPKIEIVSADYKIPHEMRKLQLLQRPMILNSLLVTDKHYADRHIMERVLLWTDVIQFRHPVTTYDRKMKATGRGHWKCEKALFSQPATTVVLIDWHKDWSSSYEGSFRAVRNSRGVTLKEVIDMAMQMVREGLSVDDFRIPGGVFVTEEECDFVKGEAPHPNSRTPCTLPLLGLAPTLPPRPGSFPDIAFLERVFTLATCGPSRGSRRSRRIIQEGPLDGEHDRAGFQMQLFSQSQPQALSSGPSFAIDKKNLTVDVVFPVHGTTFTLGSNWVKDYHLPKYADYQYTFALQEHNEEGAETVRSVQILQPRFLNELLFIREHDLVGRSPDSRSSHSIFHGSIIYLKHDPRTILSAWKRAAGKNKCLNLNDVLITQPPVVHIFANTFNGYSGSVQEFRDPAGIKYGDLTNWMQRIGRKTTRYASDRLPIDMAIYLPEVCLPVEEEVEIIRNGTSFQKSYFKQGQRSDARFQGDVTKVQVGKGDGKSCKI